MARRTGTEVRALFEWQGKPFVQWAFEALRASSRIERIAVIGPPDLAECAGLAGADLILPERDTITANLFAALDALQPRNRVLITACDNPLLSTAAFDDFLSRVPADAAVAYPILRHESFIEQFPGAKNVPIRLRGGRWIGGDCIVIEASAIPRLREAITQVLDSRKSLIKMARLLGLPFAAGLAFKRVGVAEIERQVTRIAGVEFRFVPDSNPVFVVDIDDPEDWDYLQQFNQRVNG